MRHFFFIFYIITALVFFSPISANASAIYKTSKIERIDKIIIHKKSRIMNVYYQEKLIQVYKIALGFSPKGHKHQAGDGKTPEGKYHIMAKNPNSRFHLSLKISYPNAQDKIKAYQAGVSPGGDIMIHGIGKNGWLGSLHTKNDWTLGCVAVTNEEIAELYHATSIGTAVEILP